MISPEWVVTVTDLILAVTVVAVSVGGLFYVTVRATDRAADAFAVAARRLSVSSDQPADDNERPDVVFDAEQTADNS